MGNSRLNRRIGDLNEDQIEGMIADEEDKKIRSILLVAQNLISALVALTSFVQDADARFTQHKDEYDRKSERDTKIIIQAQTIYKGATILLLLVQGSMLSLGIYAYQAFEKVQERTERTAYQLEVVMKKLDSMADLSR